jgi:hypothetical protein
MQNAIFAAFHPSPLFEAIASFAEAFALGNYVFTVTEIDDRKPPAAASTGRLQGWRHANESLALRS